MIIDSIKRIVTCDQFNAIWFGAYIMTTQKDVGELKEDMKRIEEKLDRLIENR